MPDLQEMFRMATQKVDPEPGFAARQQDHQRRHRRNRKLGAFAVTAGILAVAVAVFLQGQAGPTATPAVQPSPTADQSPSTAADIVSSVATGGHSATLSPDGSTIAFWLDPCKPNIDCSRPRTWDGPPYVLQVWLIDADGSGRRKIWQHPGCCVTISPELRWSKDGSSIVLIAAAKHRIDVTGYLPVSEVPAAQAPVISEGLRCSVSYSYWHPSAVHDYYKYRVRVENDTSRAARIDVGVTIIQGPSGSSLPYLHKGFHIQVGARSVKTVHDWFRVLHDVDNVVIGQCTTTG